MNSDQRIDPATQTGAWPNRGLLPLLSNMYRLYEVGTDVMSDLGKIDNRFLSLTGVAMTINEARDSLTPKFDWIKTNVFDHDADEPVIFHRRKIVQRKGIFGVLNDDRKRALFDKAMLRSIKVCDYNVITVVIDKLAAQDKNAWKEKHPYHYLMQILTEKFARFLDRMNDFGDIMPEGRMGKKDALLQEAYEAVRQNGNYYYSPTQIRHRIPSSNLKIRYKRDNIAGLQLADLLAHPSHMAMLTQQKQPITLGNFATAVNEVLVATKYDRSGSGRIDGYGRKVLP